MKRLIAALLLFMNVVIGHGDVKCDSIKVLFALNKATFDPTLGNNAKSMENFIDGLAVVAQSGNLDHIIVYGYSSPDGPILKNDKLAALRCNAIADYVSRHAGIPLDEIRTSPGGVAWEGLRALVAGNQSTPSREEVLRIIDK